MCLLRSWFRNRPGQIIGLLLSAWILHAPASAQWRTYNILSPYPTSHAIFAAAAPAVDHFVGMTAKGEVIITTDGGSSWVVRSVGNASYRGVKFLDQKLGWAVGAGGQHLLRTSDGGFSWQQSANAVDTTMYGVDFANSQTGWAVGYMGCIIRTTDGGASWVSQSIPAPPYSALYAVDAIDERTLFVVGDNDFFVRWRSLMGQYPANFRGADKLENCSLYGQPHRLCWRIPKPPRQNCGWG
jgi:photosystem II stability/assembly factor-like uncharacterized protein